MVVPGQVLLQGLSDCNLGICELCFVFSVPSVLNLKLYFTSSSFQNNFSPPFHISTTNGGRQLSQDLVATRFFCQWEYFPAEFDSQTEIFLYHLCERCNISHHKLDKSI